MLKHIPNHPDANFAKAEALSWHGKYQEAIDPCNLAIKYHDLGGGVEGYYISPII